MGAFRKPELKLRFSFENHKEEDSMKPTKLLLMAAFGLIMSALTVQAANTQLATTQAAKSTTIPISFLPFPPITAPGTYVVTGNLSYTSGGTNPAISINGPIAGPVIVDLKGFTITSDVGTDFKACVSITGGTGLYPTTIRNGTITTFEEGVLAYQESNVTVNNVIFNQDVEGVFFNFVTSSTVNNCRFNGGNGGPASYGIYDYQTPGGNSYNNNAFLNIFSPLTVVSVFQNQTPLVLDRCQFSPPPSN
jgi:hypothetical protein